MLKIKINAAEFYDEVKEEFVNYEAKTMVLEHSLLSVSKWESKWGVSFLEQKERTKEETLDYIRCMIVNNIPEEYVYALTVDNIQSICEYIEHPMTATKFNNTDNKPGKKEVITSEIIYYWMISMNVPFECQKWHLNRLLTLINVISIKNAPGKQMSKSELYSRNRSLNKARRERLNTRG